MLAMNYTNLRDHMKASFDRISDDCETIIVARKQNRNIVMMSEEAYNNLMENAYLRENSANYTWLMESKAQAERGELTVRETSDEK